MAGNRIGIILLLLDQLLSKVHGSLEVYFYQRGKDVRNRKIFFIGSSLPLFSGRLAQKQRKEDSALGIYQKFAIASDAPGCSTHGKNILLKGGSVIDVAIATLLCNGLVNVQSLGVGGGFIMVYYNQSEKTSYVLDARETAPSKATENMYVGCARNKKISGPFAIATPGELKGYYEAWRRFGRIPWSDIFQQSIQLLDEGVEITPTVAEVIKRLSKDIINGSELWEIIYDKGKNQFKTVGDRMFRPNLAKFFRKVAAEPEEMVNGYILREIAADLEDISSLVNLQDLVAYRPIWRDPIKIPIRTKSIYNEETDFHLHTAPPPSSGVLVGLALNVMANYNYSSFSDRRGSSGPTYFHRMLETFKFIFAKRSYLADEKFLTPEAKEFLEQLKKIETANEIQASISDEMTHNLDYYGSDSSPINTQGTSHVSALAENGDAVSVTSTINTLFGSMMVGSRTGILFNNEMDDFSSPGASDYFELSPSSANFIKAGKRPLSSMSPVIFTHATNGSLRLILGASGGSYILTSVIQSALGNLHLNMDIKRSISDDRVHHQLFPNLVRPESGFPREIIRKLEEKGHVFKCNRFFASNQGIEIVFTPTKLIRANADYRKGGDVDGI